MTRREELERLWSDPANWSPAGLYRCDADPRLMVLKRVGAGYTINAAHHRAWFLLAVLLLLSMAPLLIQLVLGRRAPAWLILPALLTPITIVVITLVWLSRRDN